MRANRAGRPRIPARSGANPIPLASLFRRGYRNYRTDEYPNNPQGPFPQRPQLDLSGRPFVNLSRRLERISSSPPLLPEPPGKEHELPVSADAGNLQKPIPAIEANIRSVRACHDMNARRSGRLRIRQNGRRMPQRFLRRRGMLCCNQQIRSLRKSLGSLPAVSPGSWGRAEWALIFPMLWTSAGPFP